jgi:phage shock protein PspC (stress-responsive transcriptional regulator)
MLNTSEKFGIGGVLITVLMIALAFGALFGKMFVAFWNFLG